MVNELSGPDERDFQILAALRAAPGSVSGQQLADRLGISRVALWKRIARLRRYAYRIEGGHDGYRLVDDDAVAPWEFQGSAPVVYRGVTDSTMDEAWRLAQAGAPSGTLVIADRQTAGRGRQGRPWRGSDGGLYLTLVLRSGLPAGHAGALALEGGCALLEWLEEAHGCRLDLHWPGDLMAGGRKVGGLLVELAGPPERPRFFLVGLGVHLHSAGAASPGLASVMGHPPLRRELAEVFRNRLAAWAKAPLPQPERWAARCPQVGRPVVLHTWLGRRVEGRLRGFDPRGALVIALRSTRETFLPGEAHSFQAAGPSSHPGEPT